MFTSVINVNTPTSKPLLPQEIFKHNKDFDQDDWWVVYKGKVYDNKRLRNTLLPFVEERESKEKEILEQKRNEKGNNKDVDSESDFSDDEDDCCLNLPPLWGYQGFHLVLPNSEYKILIEGKLRECCVGTAESYGGRLYWRDIRADVKRVLDDLIRESLRDQLSQNGTDYMNLLQRWINLYRDVDPSKPWTEVGDPNLLPFPLPVLENPESLRSWITTWECFDLDIPESGVWTTIEDENIDVSDSHEVFAASLRSDCDLSPFDTTVDGECAWKTTQERLFADDVLAEGQIAVEKQRSKRTDLHDLDRMSKRRTALMKYFTKKYNLAENKVQRYMNWADAMLNGELHFQALCLEEIVDNSTCSICCLSPRSRKPRYQIES